LEAFLTLKKKLSFFICIVVLLKKTIPHLTIVVKRNTAFNLCLKVIYRVIFSNKLVLMQFDKKKLAHSTLSAILSILSCYSAYYQNKKAFVSMI